MNDLPPSEAPHPDRAAGTSNKEENRPPQAPPPRPGNDFDKRLAEAKSRHETPPSKAPAATGREMAAGIRAFMELFGVLLGSGLMGYALDSLFGTTPKLLITFIILGIVAAIFNLYKLSRNLGTAIGSGGLQSADKDARKSPEKESGSGET